MINGEQTMVEDELPDQGKPMSDESADIDIKDLKIGDSIGSGAYGMVYRGTLFNSDVAIKKIQNEKNEKNEFIKYLKREVAVLKNIQHPNIVQFIGVYYEPLASPSLVNRLLNSSSTWIVTEYVSGGNLHERIKDTKKEFPIELRIKLSLDIALAMAYLHSRDIIFRDLKSKNILIDDSSSPIRGKVCDFGFARILNKKQQGNRHLSICGTDDFMAPEVILGMEYDETADIFSFGVVLLEMILRRKVSKVLERGPQSAFEIDQDAARQLIPDDIPILFSDLALDCIKYQAEERPNFSHIIHILKQLTSLFPVVHTFDNPLSPTSSPITPRKNSLNSPFTKSMRMNSFDFKLSNIVSSTSVQNNLKSQNLNFTLLNLNQLNNQDSPSQSQNNNNINSNSNNNNNNNNNNSNNNFNNSDINNINDCNSNLSSSTSTVYNDSQQTIIDEDELDKEDEENRNKVNSLKEKMMTVMGEFDVYINKVGKELLLISEEDHISQKYDECRKVIEIKKVLGEVIESDMSSSQQQSNTPRKNSNVTNSRVAVFLKSMERSLTEIYLSSDTLKQRITKEDDLVESLLLARVVSKIKKIHLSSLDIKN
ncbi:hypothetical protein RB653_009068 [Dictyostelium firmibasis]|uniref:non-specific serine/threonine protein kinase n=1 Tax=Dictyostelium firmibasis TaxID=79012 RepID=A0AAN7U1B5_9MYCE